MWPLLLITAVFILWLLWFLLAPITQIEKSETVELARGNEAVAYFPPSSLVHIQAGQLAQLRLDDFPWTTYGIVPATVVKVVPIVQDGRIQVTFRLLPTSDSSIPLQRGLTGSVEVEVGKTSPAALLLQAVGYRAAQIDTPNPTTTERDTP
ncbi:MAG: hypothetical protein DWQ04_12895 [Chloroflexi bacterium]|nr:MAG: hypothetical protein DWQ04_12895 [Chloroflexota bacterium]